jgi:hypothetical protein
MQSAIEKLTNERKAFMAYTRSPSEVTVREFIATSLEAEAAKMPASMKEKADVLRNAALIFREHGSKQKIRVLEEGQEEKFLID